MKIVSRLPIPAILLTATDRLPSLWEWRSPVRRTLSTAPSTVLIPHHTGRVRFEGRPSPLPQGERILLNTVHQW